jgi:hypothetical protein
MQGCNSAANAQTCLSDTKLSWKGAWMADRDGDMGDAEASGVLVAFPEAVWRHSEGPVTFSRRELDTLLKLYGRMVAAGEWRDYAIDHLRDRAVFSVFRRTSEIPLFQIAKMPALARRQGAYAVIAAGGRILKRGHALERVLSVLERKLRPVGS